MGGDAAFTGRLLEPSRCETSRVAVDHFKLSLRDFTVVCVRPLAVLLLLLSSCIFVVVSFNRQREKQGHYIGKLKKKKISWFCLHPASVIKVQFTWLLLRLSKHLLCTSSSSDPPDRLVLQPAWLPFVLPCSFQPSLHSEQRSCSQAL